MTNREKARCSYPGCDNPSRSLTLCQPHYVQQHRGGELRPLIRWDTVDCRGPECRNKAAFKTGYCRTHHSQRQRSGEVWVIGTRKREYVPSPRLPKDVGPCLFKGCGEPGKPGKGYCTKHRQLDGHMRTRYGISLAERQAKLDAQGGRCPICSKDISTEPHVDHDHTTGAVRDLLCGSCNRGLGLFQDDAGLLAKAAEYLIKHGTTG